MDELKKQAEELGIKVDGRWSEARLREEIEEALAEQEPVDSAGQESQDPEEPEPEPEPERAVVITSLIENPMKSFGLPKKGSTATLHASQLEDKAFMAKLKRAADLGMIKVQ